jgi:endogenous inhibitor of DNA gyrase (YacG/DUF329 family)
MLYECDHCGEKFEKLTKYMGHCSAHTTGNDETFECENCGDEFSNKGGLASHQQWCGISEEKRKQKVEQECVDVYEKEFGPKKEFEVECHKCGQEHIVEEREKKFPEKDRYFCSNFCSRSYASSQIEERNTSGLRLGRNQDGLRSRGIFKENIRSYLDSSDYEADLESIFSKGTEFLRRLNKGIISDFSAITCPNCGEKWVLREPDRKYCSHECHMEDLRVEWSENRSKYYKECQFDFNIWHYPEEFDLDLVRERGFYKSTNAGDNPNGVDRDHMVSVAHGWRNDIDPEIISHPANCQLLPHLENVSKNDECAITLDELKKRIEEWERKYGSG